MLVGLLRVVLGTPVLTLMLALARTSPLIALVIAFGVDYRGAGLLLALPFLGALVFSIARTRDFALSLGAGAVVGPEIAQRTALIDADPRLRRATVLLAEAEPERTVTLRGLRHTYLVTSERLLREPAAVATDVRGDLRTGVAWTLVLVSALGVAVADWRESWRLTTAAVRPGRMRALDRLVTAGLLVLAPICAVGLLIAWPMLWFALVLLPAQVRRVATGSVLGGDADVSVRRLGWGVRVGTVIATASTSGVDRWRPRSETSAFAAAAGLGRSGWLARVSRVIVSVLVLNLAAWTGFGALVGDRVTWPWESEPVLAQVDEVRVSGEGSDYLLARLGVDTRTTYEPFVLLDGERERLTGLTPVNTVPVAVGEEVEVVSWGSGLQQEWRRIPSVSLGAALTIGVIGLLLTALAMRVLTVSPWGAHRRLAQESWQQRADAGEAPRRPRPPDRLASAGFGPRLPSPRPQR